MANQNVAPTRKSWFFWSTSQSITDGIPSLTAISETCFAVALYWGISIHFQTYSVLLFSAAIAPLVLLRSNASTEWALKKFISWEEVYWNKLRNPGDLDNIERQKFLRIRRSCQFISFAVACSAQLVLWHFLSDDIGRLTAFASSVSVGLSVAVITTVVLGFFAFLVSHRFDLSPFTFSMSIANVSIKSSGFGIFLGGLTGGVLSLNWALAAGSFGCMLLLFCLRYAPKDTFYFPILFFLGVSPGPFIFAFILRFAAILRFLPEGLMALPKNFRRLTLCTSPIQAPELMPGLKTSVFAFEHIWGRYKNKTKDGSSFGAAMVYGLPAVLWFFPGWLYRIALKSTAWFWWPLAFLGGDLRYADHAALLKQKTLETLWAKASIVFSALTLFSFGFTTYFSDGWAAHANPFLTFFGFIFLIDWSLHIWQAVAILAAVTSIVIVFAADSICKEFQYASLNSDRILFENAPSPALHSLPGARLPTVTRWPSSYRPCRSRHRPAGPWR